MAIRFNLSPTTKIKLVAAKPGGFKRQLSKHKRAVERVFRFFETIMLELVETYARESAAECCIDDREILADEFKFKTNVLIQCVNLFEGLNKKMMIDGCDRESIVYDLNEIKYKIESI